MKMKILTVAIVVLALLCLGITTVSATYPSHITNWWNIQSIDTMKYSRDLSGQVLDDPQKFREQISKQLQDIADTGATHVAIATPYDERFNPVLRLWVEEARKNNLKVWFRGNFSGWEGWFDTEPITREQHTQLLKQFLTNHPELFEDGDIFSSCPECENGGPGDPRQTGDTEGFTNFLIEEYVISKKIFQDQGKQIQTNIHSMNGDVAHLVMDFQATPKLGGIVTVDHYVRDPQTLIEDIGTYAEVSNGKVVLGEYGAPIPDIHGNFTPQQQSQWLEDSLIELAREPELIGLNYWVNVGGSTALWNDDGSARPAVDVLTSYYSPKMFAGKVIDSAGQEIDGVVLKTAYKTVQTDDRGNFAVPYLRAQDEVLISAKGFFSKKLVIGEVVNTDIVLEYQPSPIPRSFFRRLKNLWRDFLEVLPW